MSRRRAVGEQVTLDAALLEVQLAKIAAAVGGPQVRIRSSGRLGVVVGGVAGYTMIRADGSTRALGYLACEFDHLEA